jgi:hypothetical protein
MRCGITSKNEIFVNIVRICFHNSEAKFLDVIGTKVLRVFLLLFFSPCPLSKSGLKLVNDVNIVNRNLKSENFQDYAQKPQQNYTFMNSASGDFHFAITSQVKNCNRVVKYNFMNSIDLAPSQAKALQIF